MIKGLRYAGVSFSSLLLLGCATPSLKTPDYVPPLRDGSNQAFTDLDVLERAIAGDMAARLGWIEAGADPDPSYDIQVYRGGPALGALVEKRPNRVVNATACVPKSADVQKSSVNVFAAYDITSNIAFKLGLPIPLSANAGRDFTSAYALSDAEMSIVPADELAAILTTPACKARLTKLEGPAWIVRGLITAKRNYKFYGKNGGGLAVTIPSASESTLTNAVAATAVGQDSAARTYFMVLSSLKGAAQSQATPPPVDSRCERLSAKVFLQRDERDTSSISSSIQDALRPIGFNVVQQIEAIEPSRMPDKSQVRYFYDKDHEAARCALTILQRSKPKAILKKLNNASPPNQIEIWIAQN